MAVRTAAAALPCEALKAALQQRSDRGVLLHCDKRSPRSSGCCSPIDISVTVNKQTKEFAGTGVRELEANHEKQPFSIEGSVRHVHAGDLTFDDHFSESWSMQQTFQSGQTYSYWGWLGGDGSGVYGVYGETPRIRVFRMFNRAQDTPKELD
jgi:hypothetical protein